MATTFFIELATAHVEHIAALIIGGLIAAPFGGYIVRYVHPRGSWLALACWSAHSRCSNLSGHSDNPSRQAAANQRHASATLGLV